MVCFWIHGVILNTGLNSKLVYSFIELTNFNMYFRPYRNEIKVYDKIVDFCVLNLASKEHGFAGQNKIHYFTLLKHHSNEIEIRIMNVYTSKLKEYGLKSDLLLVDKLAFRDSEGRKYMIGAKGNIVEQFMVSLNEEFQGVSINNFFTVVATSTAYSYLKLLS